MPERPQTPAPRQRPGNAPVPAEGAARRRFPLEETGFADVPPKYRRFYRSWRGEVDRLGENEIRCPVCGVVLRSYRELRAGDRLDCLPCLTRLQLEEGGAQPQETRRGTERLIARPLR